MKWKTLKKVLPTIQKAHGGRPPGSLSACIILYVNGVRHLNLDDLILDNYTVLSIDCSAPTSFPRLIIMLRGR